MSDENYKQFKQVLNISLLQIHQDEEREELDDNEWSHSQQIIKTIFGLNSNITKVLFFMSAWIWDDVTMVLP